MKLHCCFRPPEGSNVAPGAQGGTHRPHNLWSSGETHGSLFRVSRGGSAASNQVMYRPHVHKAGPGSGASRASPSLRASGDLGALEPMFLTSF